MHHIIGQGPVSEEGGRGGSVCDADGTIQPLNPKPCTRPLQPLQFGTVYLGEWRSSMVAVKRMTMPAAMSNSDRAEKMAVMEAAISSR